MNTMRRRRLEALEAHFGVGPAGAAQEAATAEATLAAELADLTEQELHRLLRLMLRQSARGAVTVVDVSDDAPLTDAEWDAVCRADPSFIAAVLEIEAAHPGALRQLPSPGGLPADA